MQKVDDQIRYALRQYAAKCGSVLALSRLLGVSHSTVLFWLNGKIRHISTDIWNKKVLPILEDSAFIRNEEEDLYREFENDQNSQVDLESYLKMFVPLIREELFLSYSMPLENIVSFAGRNAHTKIFFETGRGKRKYYAAELEHVIGQCDLPWKILVFFSENIRLSNGELALIRFQEENFLRICRFFQKEKYCIFKDIISRNIIACGRTADPCHLAWAFPVAAIRFNRKE